MKTLVIICRWLVGLLFIFSGLVKANDPLGLSFKMLEFFEKWEIHFLDNYSLAFAVFINILEVVAGVGIILAWKPKWFSWLLLALISFFTFLTAYVLFSGKIHACGCFGDCIPLTPKQTFTKDIILLVLILVVLFNVNKIQSSISSKTALFVLAVTFMVVVFIENYVQKHLPFKDCLAYKAGNNILEQMKPPVSSVPDSFAIFYTYKKDEKLVKINAEKFPDDFDSTYTQVGDEEKILVRKGNAEAKIGNFSLMSLSGNDSTKAILNTEKYAMLFVKDFASMKTNQKVSALKTLEDLNAKKIPVYIVTNDKEGATQSAFNKYPIFICDATEIKTAARVNPTFLFMRQATIIKKVAAIDGNQLLQL